MNKNTINGLLATASNKAKSAYARTNMLVGVTGLALAPHLAFAAADEFDGAEIVTKVVTYTAVGVLILGAFALGRWTLRAMGLIGGK